MIGVLVNVGAVLLGTAVGLLFGGLISEKLRDISFRAVGLSVLIIGISMSLGGLKALGASHLGNFAPLVLVGSLVVGGIFGEAVGIERGLERFGQFLQEKTAKIPLFAPATENQPGAKAHTLVEGFVTASLLFCVGAMTILGSIQSGLGDPSLLYLKSLLDGIASVALATSFGAGVGLSVIPVIAIQGAIALGAGTIQPYMTVPVIAGLECVGGALILAIGLDLTGIKRLPYGNMLPGVLIAAFIAGIWG
ncbi:MAG: DUF554 domain-containing protein [Actinomycetota bacterium]|nr:MAG: hypothetical protein FD171_1094 [Actinomycetota bacterium]MDO8949514.1 DUF554 domain-containing protein [Actinomycetota bacterium]MDP3629475.1 DUF554 domain-containing protein [Actinomycetota bacterium]